jgi:hypothetical protein
MNEMTVLDVNEIDQVSGGLVIAAATLIIWAGCSFVAGLTAGFAAMELAKK